MKSRMRRLYCFVVLAGTLCAPLADAAEDRSWVERSAPEAIYRAPQHEYTRKLLAAIPRGIEGRLVA
jgi:hypothetical protein